MHTGFVHKVDVLGRIVIPKETKDVFSLNTKDPLEITIEERTGEPLIVLSKYYTGCIFCNAVDDCITFKDMKVCRKCLDEL